MQPTRTSAYTQTCDLADDNHKFDTPQSYSLRAPCV